MTCCATKTRPAPFSGALRRLELKTLGRSVGSDGYTTMAQARRLAGYLSVTRTDSVLDLGSGWGWPGCYLAEATGCRLIATDVGLDQVRAAAERLDPRRVRTDAHFVAGDGRALPFASGTFDAVSHSDLLCCVPDKIGVLRECHRVLRAGGRMGGYLIHTPPGLSGTDLDRAATLGPSAVVAPAAPGALLRRAGFEVLVEVDLTTEFAALVRATLRARTDLEAELRREEGHDTFDEEYQRKRSMLAGIEAGLLVRSAVIARKPAA